MKSLSLFRTSKDLASGLQEMAAFRPSFVLVFASPTFFLDPTFGAQLKAGLGDVPFIGCSTGGEIWQRRVLEGVVVLLGARFDKVQVQTASLPLPSIHESYETGHRLAQLLPSEGLRHVFVLGPGIGVNGSEMVRGLREGLGKDVGLSGGLASDGTRFQKTCTILNGLVSSDRFVALGFYGKSLRVGYGTEGGWRVFGPARRVTRADGPFLYELDDRPALQLYREYLGEKAVDLPASGLFYPLALLKDDRNQSGIIRSFLDMDLEKGAIILSSSIKQGSFVCLMHGDNFTLTTGARDAALRALEANPIPGTDGLVIAVSCIARRLVMSVDTEDETEAISNVFGAQIALGGFYSHGEICPFGETMEAEFHNQTMTLTYFTEASDT